MDFLGKFNKTFKEFTNDLVQSFPNDPDFKMYKIAVSAAMIMNENLVIGVFKEKVIDLYSDKILAKDDAFFMDNSYNELQGEFSEASAIIQKLKGYWSGMSTEDREVVWRYFVVLVKLGQKYYA
jgi:hypothetical protein